MPPQTAVSEGGVMPPLLELPLGCSLHVPACVLLETQMSGVRRGLSCETCHWGLFVVASLRIHSIP